MDPIQTRNPASRTYCPALTRANVPMFSIPIIGGRKGVQPGSGSPQKIKPRAQKPLYDAKMRDPHHFVSSVHIDSHFESELIDSNNDMKYEIWSESDPGMKLSMTYDHIPKVKTPYGFYFLQHSPTAIKREALLLSTRYRDRKIYQSSPFSHLDRRSLIAEHCVKEECSQEHPQCNSCVRLTSELTTESSESMTKALCKTDVLLSPAKDSNSIQVSTSLTYESSARKCSIKMSTSINNPKMSFHPMMERVSRTPKLSIDKERHDAINKLHMLCVRQLCAFSCRDLGEIELALQYDRRSRRLRVRVLQASGVGLSSKNNNTHVRLCIMPDKQNPQQTKVVKGTCDPIYNEDFYFNVSPYELISSGLRVRVFQSSGLLMNKCHVGEIWLNLAELKGTSEIVHIREDLKPKADERKRSMLNVSICYRSRIRKLCITVIRAQKLSKSGFLKTAPDCQVKVEVTQVKNNAISTVFKRTGVRRHTRNPVFKESMSFEINDLNNLRDGMTVVCTLSSKSLTGKHQTLGQVRFGLGSSRASEKQQWTNVLQNPGHSITQWHTL